MYWKALPLLLAGASSVCTELGTEAQVTQVLHGWGDPWRYNQAGADLGIAWRSFSYPEETAGAWRVPSPGLLGSEENPQSYAVHAPFRTPLGVSTSVTTYYFRATFQFSNTTAGLSLVATNLIDDGAVIYLNGDEVGRFRVPLSHTAATLASASPAAEGILEPLIITNLASLRQGTNVLAVEVHQSAATSVDVAYGMKLMAIWATPLGFTSQPRSQVAVVGDPFTLSVAVTGGPASYQWHKGNVPIANATNSTYSVASAQPSYAGDYHVVVTNTVSALTSQVARIQVIPDTIGPRVIDAVGETNYYRSRNAHTIAISFTEPLPPSATNPANFVVYPIGDSQNPVPFTNVTYTFLDRPRIHLWMTGPAWSLGGDYVAVLNQVPDHRGNLICPNTRVPVSWQLVTNLTRMAEAWAFHDSELFEPTVYEEPWYGTNYIPGCADCWGSGPGIFQFDFSNPGLTCAGNTPQTRISFQYAPTLFRRTFMLPPGLGTNGFLRLRFVADDGMIVYLNGREAYTYNARPNSGPVTAASRAITSTEHPCVTNVTLSLAGLLPQQNWLAAAVLQGPDPQADTSFGLEIDGIFFLTPPLPADPPADQLVLSHTREDIPGGAVRISWPATFGGYCLEYKTNLDTALPWISVSNQSNPFIESLTGGTRLFRLSKP